MPRSNLERTKLRLNGGINQQEDDASMEQCSDCLNVWAPKGRLETRPGYRGVSTHGRGTATITVLKARGEDVSAGTFRSPDGAGTLNLSNLEALDQDGGVAADRWYLGHSAPFDKLQLFINSGNLATTFYVAEYWNGTNWAEVRVLELSAAGEARVTTHLEVVGGIFRVIFSLCRPQDWATTTVDSQSAYWIRFSLRGDNLTGATRIGVDNVFTHLKATDAVRGLFTTQFPTSKRYIFVHNWIPGSGSKQLYVDTATSIDSSELISTSLDNSNGSPDGFADDIPATIAVVPDYNEAFVSYNHASGHIAMNEVGDVFMSSSKVESRDFAVGAGAPYDPNYIAQDTTWPRAKFTTFFDNRIWCAGIAGDPFKIQWSAPAPYHKVWPSLSFEQLMEDDNSPITAMQALGEQMVVFKQDSIWLLIDSGLDSFGLRRFTPKRIVAGVGCSGNNSVQQIRGNLIFLSEDGIYKFDGTPNVLKVTTDSSTGADRLYETIDSITPKRRPFSASIHWKTEQLYILSFSTDGEATVNDTTVVWDYDHDEWWIWDNIDAQHWLSDEDVNDNEILYFGDSAGRVYRFGVGRTDHGAAISSSVKSQRIFEDGEITRRCRQVSIMSDNRTAAVSCEILANDEPSGSSGTVNFTDTANEANIIPRRRRKRLDYRKDGNWFQVKLSHSTKNERMYVSYVDLGFLKLGCRR